MEREYLEFERPIAALESQINELRRTHTDPQVNLAEEIIRLEDKTQKLIESIYRSLKPSQVVQVARHPERPYFKDYLPLIFDRFTELHGDRVYRDGTAIIGGTAYLDNQPVMVIGQQKGREVKEKVHHNFGMPRPEGYRKANRLMQLAEKFKLPVLTFIDTPGAYPGIEAEEHNQSQAIAQNLFDMAKLNTPIIATIIGEGGSGGALAIGMGDRILMLQHSVYSVISPEGCASILWKDAKHAPQAAESLGLTSERLKELGLIDDVIAEPIGGAHRDIKATAKTIKQQLITSLQSINKLPSEARMAQRYDKFMLSALTYAST